MKAHKLLEISAHKLPVKVWALLLIDLIQSVKLGLVLTLKPVRHMRLMKPHAYSK